MIKGLKITCKEATEICDRSQYKEASFLDIIRLKLHIAICKICAAYSKQNSMLSRIVKSSKICQNPNFQLNDDLKEKMKEELKKDL